MSPRTLPILSYSFGTSSEVSSWEGRVFLQIVTSWHFNFLDTSRVALPGFTQ